MKTEVRALILYFNIKIDKVQNHLFGPLAKLQGKLTSQGLFTAKIISCFFVSQIHRFE